MIYAVLTAWITTSVLILRERKIARTIIYLAIFSLLSSLCFMLLGSPDVAIAEATTSAFSTVFFIVCFERYFNYKDKHEEKPKKREKWHKIIIPAIFTIFLFALVLFVMPDSDIVASLGDLYISSFAYDIGGENAVTAIYLGYRVYDTLFEALVLVVGVVAVIHMSHSKKTAVKSGKHSEIERNGMAIYAIRIICPVMLLFGVYLIFNGHVSPGGGFQGGLVIASFFICRYMIYDIYDLPIKKLSRLEDFVFVGIVLVAVFIVFLGIIENLPDGARAVFQIFYLLAMNILIGLKVACGFIILVYRYIAVEQK